MMSVQDRKQDYEPLGLLELSQKRLKHSKNQIEKRIQSSMKKPISEKKGDNLTLKSKRFILDELKDKVNVITIAVEDHEEGRARGIAVNNTGQILGFDLDFNEEKDNIIRTWDGFIFEGNLGAENSKKK